MKRKRRIIVCQGCQQEKEYHGKEMCYKCYRKFKWSPKKIICVRCQRERPHQSSGYCNSCYNRLFHYDRVKEYNIRKYHNISLEIHQKITQKCVLCGFSKAVDLHHLDGEHGNNNLSNLVGLCPNHHAMYHKPEWKEEISIKLMEKGYTQ